MTSVERVASRYLQAGQTSKAIEADLKAAKAAAHEARTQVQKALESLRHAHQVIAQNPNGVPIWAYNLVRRGDSPFGVDPDVQRAVEGTTGLLKAMDQAMEGFREDGSWHNKP